MPGGYQARRTAAARARVNATADHGAMAGSGLYSENGCQAADVTTGRGDRRRVGGWFGCPRSECPMTETELQHGNEQADGVVDLLGMLAYAALSSFFRLSAD